MEIFVNRPKIEVSAKCFSDLHSGVYLVNIGVRDYQTLITKGSQGVTGIDKTGVRSWAIGSHDYASTELYNVVLVTVDSVTVTVVD